MPGLDLMLIGWLTSPQKLIVDSELLNLTPMIQVGDLYCIELTIVFSCIGMIYNYMMEWNVFSYDIHLILPASTLIRPNELNLTVRCRVSSTYHIFMMLWVDSKYLPLKLQESALTTHKLNSLCWMDRLKDLWIEWKTNRKIDG